MFSGSFFIAFPGSGERGSCPTESKIFGAAQCGQRYILFFNRSLYVLYPIYEATRLLQFQQTNAELTRDSVFLQALSPKLYIFPKCLMRFYSFLSNFSHPFPKSPFKIKVPPSTNLQSFLHFSTASFAVSKSILLP